MNPISTFTLACGATLVVEKISAVRSVALNWLIPAGSAYDPASTLGRAAVTSEMLLRGAGDLDSRAFTDACDMLGMSRSVDAGTLHMKISAVALGNKLHDALSLLTSLALHPRLEPSSLEPARELALASIEALADDPHHRAVLAARARHYPEPLNRSGLGTTEGLNALTLRSITEGWTSACQPLGSIIAVAGNVEPHDVREHLETLLKSWTGTPTPFTLGPRAMRGYDHELDDSNQVQIIAVHDAPPAPAPEAYLEQIVVSILSGGMSGRLFTEVREKRALCYSVSASYRADREFGSITGYVGTTPERAQESLDVLIQELHRVNEGVSREEFDRAIVGLKSRVIFSGESSPSRAAALASDQFKLGRPRSLDEIAARLDSITLDDVNSYLSNRPLGTFTIQTLGPTPLTPPSRNDR
jgi:predicted Zn-dependent peptidase